MFESAFEVYMQKYRITMWRDECVYRTELIETGWFPEAAVKANQPQKTWIQYAAADDAFARENMTIRKSKEAA